MLSASVYIPCKRGVKIIDWPTFQMGQSPKKLFAPMTGARWPLPFTPLPATLFLLAYRRPSVLARRPGCLTM